MNKVIRDGKVAVLVSAGYGAGWSTWSRTQKDEEILMFHPTLVEMVEQGRRNEITEEWYNKEFGFEDNHYTCLLGKDDGLHIEWVPVGTQFRIEEYDGSETLKTINDYNWITA